MKLVARLAWVWLVGCNGRDAPARQPGPLSPSSAERPGAELRGPPTIAEPRGPAPIAAPHGGRIELVAITDPGDAALTADSFGEIRLWPTLDGTHEPVVVRGSRSMQLALGRDHKGLVSAILDEAGGVELQRFDADGGLLGRAQLPAQPSIEQVVAIPGGVLVRRADHHIVRFDPRGGVTGELVPAAGQRVVSLAVRRDRAVAGITSTDEPRARTVQWIALGRSLAWGASVELPEPLADLAIAPGGRRLAGISRDEAGNDDVGQIVELEPRPVVVGTIMLAPRRRPKPKGGRPRSSEPPIIGFADDGHVVAGVRGQLKWASANGTEPWIVGERVMHRPEGEIAIGDRVAVAQSAALQVSDVVTDRILGYQFLGEGFASTAHRFRDGAGVLLEVNGGKLWLDPELRARSPVFYPNPPDLELVLDDHHLLFTPLIYDEPRARKHRILVRDIMTRTDTELAVIANVTAAQYDPGTRVLAIATGEDIVRYRLTFDPVVATPLRTLSHAGELRPMHLTDPALANGVVAVVGGDDQPPRALVYRIEGDDRGPPVAPQSLALSGPIDVVDRAGTIYVVDKGLRIYRDGRPGESLARVRASAISHDGTLLAAGYANEVTVADTKGVERWRRPVWHAGPVAWSPDDRTLFVAADGGAALSFDAATGKQLAIRCGWGFGLYDDDVTTSSNTPSACAAQ